MKKAVWLLPIVCVFAGCVSSSVTTLNPNKNYSEIDSDSVRVYLSEEDIDCEFEKVALIKTKAGYGLKDDLSVKKARKKAGSAGANAIILEEFEDPSTGAKIAGAFFGTGANKKGEMLAIRVDESKCTEKTASE